MKRHHWGELTETVDGTTLEKQIQADQEIMIEKRGELKILHSSVFFEPKETHIKLLSKNQSVNQIIGLKQKQDMLQELIETSKHDLYGFQQLVPTLKESIEVISSRIPITKNEKFNKLCMNLSSGKHKGKPFKAVPINKTCCTLALKKSICGVARVADYSHISESALTMMTDAVDHFLKSLMESITLILENDDRDSETDVDLLTFERAYFSLTGGSATNFFDYFKREIIDKHQQAVTSFSNKVSELKTIVDNHTLNEMTQPDFYQSFFVKEEIKKEEYDDYDT